MTEISKQTDFNCHMQFSTSIQGECFYWNCMLKGSSAPIFINIGWREHSKLEFVVFLHQTPFRSSILKFISKQIALTQEP